MGVETLHDLYREHPVVDWRPRAYWLGEGEFDANIKYGRIPGSLSQPWEDLLKTDADGLIQAEADAPLGPPARHPLDRKEIVLPTCFGAAGAAIDSVYFKAAGFGRLRLDDEGHLRWNPRDYPLVKGQP